MRSFNASWPVAPMVGRLEMVSVFMGPDVATTMDGLDFRPT